MKTRTRLDAAVLRIILADAELELVPAEMVRHPQVRAHAKAQGKDPARMLLDQNHHHAACRKLPEGERRGRPDIAHYSLLTILESPLCKAGGVEVGIHTRHGQWIRVRPDTRLPRGEARFHGVMAKVLAEGRSQEQDPLLWVDGDRTPEQVLEAFAQGPVVRLDPAGTASTFEGLPGVATGSDLTIVVGCFGPGDYRDAWRSAVPDSISLWTEPLMAWSVLAECLAHWRVQKAPSPPATTPRGS